MKKETVITFWIVNFICFILGALIVWFETHSIVAMLGVILASLHFKKTVTVLANQPKGV